MSLTVTKVVEGNAANLILEKKYVGVVSKWIHSKGFGFIKIQNNSTKIFVNRKEVKGIKNNIESGLEVEFILRKSEKGYNAVDCQLSNVKLEPKTIEKEQLTVEDSNELIERALTNHRKTLKEDTCFICLQDGSRPTIMLLCCGQATHITCMDQWYRTKGEYIGSEVCPNCRQSAPEPKDEHTPPVVYGRHGRANRTNNRAQEMTWSRFMSDDNAELHMRNFENAQRMGSITTTFADSSLFGEESGLFFQITSVRPGFCISCQIRRKSPSCDNDRCALCCPIFYSQSGRWCSLHHFDSDEEEYSDYSQSETEYSSGNESEYGSNENETGTGDEGTYIDNSCFECNQQRATNCTNDRCSTCCKEMAWGYPCERHGAHFASGVCVECENQRAADCVNRMCGRCCPGQATMSSMACYRHLNL